MGSTSQIEAVVKRFAITQIRSPIRSIIRILVWPGLVIGILLYFLITNYGNDYMKNLNLEAQLSPITILLTGFHLWYFTEYLITDRANGMKSLMILMGLKRNSYYVGNTICLSLCILPLVMIVAIISILYLFEDTKASSVIIILLYILVVIHLAGVAFATASFITSTSYVTIFVIILFLQFGYHSAMKWLMIKVPASLWPLVLIIAHASPYESIAIFSDSYLLKQNSCSSIEFINDDGRTLICQPTYLSLILTSMWILAAFGFARWFDEVCPWQNDTAIKSPLFCLKSSISHEDFSGSEDEINNSSIYFENVGSINQEVGIQIGKVTKKFKNVVAVENLSFKIFKGETTLLLGHNGAGKTTLMNIILGRLTPDQGTVIMGQKTRAVGICPQTSIFDDNLTVKQHLELFANIKSCDMSRSERHSHIRTTIDDVSLGSHADKTPSELSGGMKRKLSLAMAFVGKSDVLILDEPSSGLDPDSRVFIWNAIRRYRKDRTVLLSTQHMEEADYLGDRIAIMAEGKLICCGSSLFLKEVLGNYYKLRIECNRNKDKEVLSLVRRFFNLAKLLSASDSNTVKELIVELVDEKKEDLEQKLIDMLEYIENNSSSQHNILSYGLKCSSIEDVMLNTDSLRSTNVGNEATRLSLVSTGSNIEILAKSFTSPDLGFWLSQRSFLYALLAKHLQTYGRDYRKIMVFRILVPIITAYSMMNSLLDRASGPVIEPAFLVIHFIYYPVRERISKFKTMQLTSYANVGTYWLSQLIVDSLSIIFIVISISTIQACMFKGVYMVSENLVYFVLIVGFTLFGISAAIFSYILSTIFQDVNTCIGYQLLVYAVSPILLVLQTLLQLAFTRHNLSWLNTAIIDTFTIITPTDSLQTILRGLNTKCYIRKLNIPCTMVEGFSPIIFGLLALSAQIVVYSVLLMWLEYKNIDLSWYIRYKNIFYCFRKTPTQVGEHRRIDQDVVDESVKAIQLINNVSVETHSLVAADLNKSYIKGTKVIDHLSFRVKKGECFGLLGVNGAGKSTTFSMISAESMPDEGRIWINGSYNPIKYRPTLGYDPQTNPETSLTPVEALNLMARLRRINEHSIPMLVNSILDLLQMNEHRKKKVDELSGGTKRKLALGMSLIGNPNLVALDEPTAGVDPMARVDIWSLLRSLRTQNNSSIIISSHAMEECEAVCDRIAIMARGRLRCLGTFLHLKAKFAQGGRLRVQFSKVADEQSSFAAILSELESELQEQFGIAVKLVDTNVNSATFNISDGSVKRSSLLKLMRDFRRKHPSLHHMLSDSSLEDIFISLAQEQQQLATAS